MPEIYSRGRDYIVSDLMKAQKRKIIHLNMVRSKRKTCVFRAGHSNIFLQQFEQVIKIYFYKVLKMDSPLIHLREYDTVGIAN